MLTQEELEKLVRLVGSGKNTYAELHKEFPYMTNTDWMCIIGDDFPEEENTRLIDCPKNIFILKNKKAIIFFTEIPDDYSAHYQFKPTDSFELSVTYKDLLYQLKKEDINKRLIVVSCISSIIAAITGIISLMK